MMTDRIPWSTRLFLSACSLALDACSRFDLLRRLFLLFDTRSPPSSTKLVTSFDVTVDLSRNLWFRLYFPSSSSSASTLPLLLYFHGGGFVFGSPSTAIYDNLCRRLAHDLQAVVVSVNYRLAPDHRYPCQYDDGLDVLKFIDAQNRAFLPSSTDLNRCFVAGDSAGGNIAHHVTLRACDHVFEKAKIIGVVAIQPFFGGEERTEWELRGAPILNTRRTDWMWRSFLPKGSSRDHEAANVSGEITADKFPATVVFVGGFDPLQGWQRRYCEGLRKSGKEVELVEYPNAIHGFCTFPRFPHFEYLIGTLREFIQKQSAASK